MKIQKINGKVKCDMAFCKSKAAYSIDSKVSISQNINLCDSCARELYLALGKLFTPKSPKNLIRKAEKEEINGI